MKQGRKEERRAQALERQTARDARSDKEQYNRLVTAGHAECKEAERLLARIEAKEAAAEFAAKLERDAELAKATKAARKKEGARREKVLAKERRRIEKQRRKRA